MDVLTELLRANCRPSDHIVKVQGLSWQPAFGGRVHPRTRAGGGAHWIQVLRSRTKETMGGAEVSEANGVPTKVAAWQYGAVMI